MGVPLVYTQFTQGWNEVTEDRTLRFLVKIPKLPAAVAERDVRHEVLFFREVLTVLFSQRRHVRHQPWRIPIAPSVLHVPQRLRAVADAPE